MKHLAAISVTMLLLFNTIGYYFVFYGDMLAVKHEAEALISGQCSHGDELVSLAFPMLNGKPLASGLNFIDDDEFVYQGRMYDVISSSKTNGIIIYKCYTDTKETMLNHSLCNKIDSDNGSPARNHKSSITLKELLKDYTPNKVALFIADSSATCSDIHADKTELPPDINKAIVSPPPEATL